METHHLKGERGTSIVSHPDSVGTHTFCSGRTVMSFIAIFVFLLVTAWYIGVNAERYIFSFSFPYVDSASAVHTQHSNS